MMTEIFGLLLEAKKLGLDITQLVLYITIYVLLRRDLSRLIDAQFNKLIAALKSLENAHNERLNKIEVHVGLKKGHHD